MGPSVNKGLLRTNTELLSLETKTFLVSECFLGSAQDGLPLGHSASAALPIDKVKQKRGGDRLRSVVRTPRREQTEKDWKLSCAPLLSPKTSNLLRTASSLPHVSRKKVMRKVFYTLFFFLSPFPPGTQKKLLYGGEWGDTSLPIETRVTIFTSKYDISFLSTVI